MSKKSTEEQVQVNFRMPVELRDRLRSASRQNNRSLNAEIVDRLQLSIDGGDPKDVYALIESFEQRVRATNEKQDHIMEIYAKYVERDAAELRAEISEIKRLQAAIQNKQDKK